ncbi:MAG: NADH-quinone oxidoreductase subunit C [Sporomusaceae bacterium]|nr:NADH-quinone oxidoreductase subunit C [Sporomusaceae bacterium]
MAVNIEPVLVRYLVGLFPSLAAADRAGDGLTVVTAPPEEIYAVLKTLRHEEPFSMDTLGDLTAVDYPDRLEVVYHLYSAACGHKLAVKTSVAKGAAALPTVTGLWPAAEFAERETYDLLGVTFTGHPNLTRILLPEGFEGHPLRKDYSLPPRPATR